MKMLFRKQLFVDPQVQGAILLRGVMYWFACISFVVFLLSIVRTLATPDRYLYEHLGDVLLDHWPVLAVMLVMLPFVLFDTLRLTNKFAGPVYRLRRDLARFAQGDTIRSVKFRDGDFWQDLGEQVHQLIERVTASETKLAAFDTAPREDLAEASQVDR